MNGTTHATELDTNGDPALLAVALSLAAVSGASAQEGGDALAEDNANAASVTANETDPDESNNSASAGRGAALAISCDEAATALHPSLATLVCRVFSLIPPGAQAAITSVIEAHREQRRPGLGLPPSPQRRRRRAAARLRPLLR